MDVTVIGCGRWGSFIATYLANTGHHVTLYGQEGAESYEMLRQQRKNQYITLPQSVVLTHRLAQALVNEVIIISIPSQALRGLMAQLNENGAKNKLYVLCMKGLEIATGYRLTQVVEQAAAKGCRAAVWIGPGHVQDFMRGVPNCMVIDAALQPDKEMLVQAFSSDLIRFYYGNDLIGNEIGAAAKNVIGIAAGMLDGLNLTSLKGALMSRGCREVGRLIAAMGGSELSAYGLCHLGDYEATVFSPHSHNRAFGERFVKGETFDALAEGYYTADAIYTLAQQHGVDMPICAIVYGILYQKLPPQEALDVLFSRSLKQEFEGSL